MGGAGRAARKPTQTSVTAEPGAGDPANLRRAGGRAGRAAVRPREEETRPGRLRALVRLRNHRRGRARPPPAVRTTVSPRTPPTERWTERGREAPLGRPHHRLPRLPRRAAQGHSVCGSRRWTLDSHCRKAPLLRSRTAGKGSRPGRPSSPGTTLHPEAAGRPDSRQRPRFLLEPAGARPTGFGTAGRRPRRPSTPGAVEDLVPGEAPTSPGTSPGPARQSPRPDPLPAGAAARPEVPSSVHRGGRSPRVPAHPGPVGLRPSSPRHWARCREAS